MVRLQMGPLHPCHQYGVQGPELYPEQPLLMFRQVQQTEDANRDRNEELYTFVSTNAIPL